MEAMVKKAADNKGYLDGYLKKGYDPRGRFITETLFQESHWPPYRDAYDKAYLRGKWER